MDQEESRLGASVSTEKVAPGSKRKSTDWPPQLLIPRLPQVLLEWGLMWGSPGTFSPDCLGSPTPGACASEGNLFSNVVLADLTWSQGQLRCLRAMPLEMPLLSIVVTSPSLFTCVSLSIFPQAASQQV